MQNFKISKFHKLNINELKERITAYISDFEFENRDILDNFSNEWLGNMCLVKMEILKSKLGFAILIDPNFIEVSYNLPPIALKFKNNIEDGIREKLKDIVSKIQKGKIKTKIKLA